MAKKKYCLKGAICNFDYHGVWGDYCSPRSVREFLDGLNDGEEAEIEINSPGGLVVCGIEIANAIKNCKHAGVLLMSWDADNLPEQFDEDTWTAGAVVIPQSWRDGNVSRKWNASFPFNIKAERFED